MDEKIEGMLPKAWNNGPLFDNENRSNGREVKNKCHKAGKNALDKGETASDDQNGINFTMVR